MRLGLGLVVGMEKRSTARLPSPAPFRHCWLLDIAADEPDAAGPDVEEIDGGGQGDAEALQERRPSLRLVDQIGFVGDVPRQADDVTHPSQAAGDGHQAGPPGQALLRQVECPVVGKALAGLEAFLKIGNQAIRDLLRQAIRRRPVDELVERPSGEAGDAFIGVLERCDTLVIDV
jgi:hypothetical protein